MANDIRYVCVSDLHLGEEESILTNFDTSCGKTDNLKASPTLKIFVEVLTHLISQNQGVKKPTLILNGDILELALATTNEAVMAFERFIELVMKPEEELFSDIVFLAGNHDHHLWETARETQYVHYLEDVAKTPGSRLKIPWHTTRIFDKKDSRILPSYFLTSIVQRFENMEKLVIKTAYPTYGLTKQGNGDNPDKLVLFNHGHYIESIYHLMSTLKTLVDKRRIIPKNIWDIEAENFAWIDFFWSTLGRSGEVGQEVEIIYEKMQNRKAFKEVLSGLAKNIVEKRIDSKLKRWAAAKVLEQILHKSFDKFSPERGHVDSILSDEAMDGLRSMVEGPIFLQLREEKYKPDDVTFIFGHTHKPFEKPWKFKNYDKEVKVYNSGGWVVSSQSTSKVTGGAVILLDKDLNATSLRLYNEHESANEYEVKVEEALIDGSVPSLFYEKIKGLVDKTKPPWNVFSKIVASEIEIRRKVLNERIGDAS